MTYRAPDPPTPCFTFDAVRGRVARGTVIAAALLMALNLSAAAWLLFDHYGFVTRAWARRSFALRPEVWGTALVWLLLPLSVAFLVRAVARARRNASPAVDRALARHGDPVHVAREVEREVAAASETFGDVTLTAHWLLHERPLGVDLVRVEEIAWVYARDTDHRVNGIKVAATRGVAVHTRSAPYDAVALALPCSADDRPRLFAGLADRAPWCLLGYSADRADRWARDRAGLLAAIDRSADASRSAAGATASDRPG
ncbi:MAG: hypothetical protein R3A48_28805 [Polyangiales bacterium]